MPPPKAALRVWLVAIHWHGHISPLLSLVPELQQLGYECVVVSNDLAAPKVSPLLPAGARFLSLGPNYCTLAQDDVDNAIVFSPDTAVATGIRTVADKLTAMERSMCEGLWRLLAPGSAETRPDLIISDLMSMAGLDAADKFGIPAVALNPTPLSLTLEFAGQNSYNLVAGVPAEQMGVVLPAAMSLLQRWVLNPLAKRLGPLPLSYVGAPRRDAVRAHFGLPPLANRALFAVPPLPRGFMMLVSTVWELEHRRPLPPNWHMCGPVSSDFSRPAPAVEDSTCLSWCEDALAAGRPLVLVVFGSMVRPTPPQAQALADAMRQLPQIQFLWGLHADCVFPLGAAPLPANVLRQAWVPQVSVLFHPACRAFVSHCGMSSLHEAAAAGVPVVAVPYGADQFINAQHVEDQGRGRKVKAHVFTAEMLAAAIGEVALSPTMLATCKATAAAVCANSGPRTAAMLIDGFMKALP